MFIAYIQIRIILVHISSVSTKHTSFLLFLPNICIKITEYFASRKSFPVGLDSDFASLIVREEENEAIVAV